MWMEPKIDNDKRLNEEKRLRIRNNRHFFLLLLAFLVALVLADGVVTRFLVNNGLGSEANPFLKMWVKSDLLFVIKLVGASLAACILWILYRTKPKMAWITASIFVSAYALIIIWNIIVFYIATGRLS